MWYAYRNTGNEVEAVIFGILGTGNMGEAILRGILSSDTIAPEQVLIFDVNVAKRNALRDELHVQAAESVEGLLERADMVLLAVKPNICEGLLNQYRALFADKAIVSIVTGWNQARLCACLPANVRTLCIMPNTPVMADAGMIVFEKGNTLTDEEEATVQRMFRAVGRVATIDGKLMPAVIGVSGSGPAYAYVFIEAMADAGVKHGLPRATAYELAAQTLLGASKMVLESGVHPGELKDRVCSPGGTTIEAIASLERSGFRGAVIDAIDACCNKAEEMSK